MLNCVVIGAGPGGIVCTKELLERGVKDVVCLEQADRIGSTFSDSYDNLQLTSSVLLSMFSDFWVGDGLENHFWSKSEVVDYWTRYAEHFGVTRHLRLGARVAAVTHCDDGTWEIELDSGERLLSERVVVAIGNNTTPSYPDWRSALTGIACFHSKDYKNAESFKGKRVLVVGGGESGSDVALEISRVAERCWVSLRESTGWVVPRKSGLHAMDISTHRGIGGLPREYGEALSKHVNKLERARNNPVFDALADLNSRVSARRGIWGTYGTKTLALPKAIAHYGCEVVGGIVGVAEGGKRLETADGKTLDGVDAVVFCTGFQNRVSLLPEALQSCDPRSLYKHMFHPGVGDRLAWIGWARPGFGGHFPVMEMQARLFALVCAGEHVLPGPAEMERVAAVDRLAYLEQFESNGERVRSLVDYHRYMDDLAAVIGCTPPLLEYAFRHPRLWLRMVYGPTQATQFRLRGPGKKVALAQEIVGKLPVSTFNHIVKAGLRGRLRYGLKAMVPNFLKGRDADVVSLSLRRARS